MPALVRPLMATLTIPSTTIPSTIPPTPPRTTPSTVASTTNESSTRQALAEHDARPTLDADAPSATVAADRRVAQGKIDSERPAIGRNGTRGVEPRVVSGRAGPETAISGPVPGAVPGPIAAISSFLGGMAGMGIVWFGSEFIPLIGQINTSEGRWIVRQIKTLPLLFTSLAGGYAGSQLGAWLGFGVERLRDRFAAKGSKAHGGHKAMEN